VPFDAIPSPSCQLSVVSNQLSAVGYQWPPSLLTTGHR
jgi:hypothetical protein